MNTTDRTKALFAAVENGHYTLPARLTKMRTGLQALWQHQLDPSPDESDTHARLVLEMADAAEAGRPLPDVTTLEATRAAQRAHADAVSVTLAAADALLNRLNAATADAAEEIITEHLRPRFDAALAALTDACAITGKYADDPAAALSAPAKDRAAFVAVTEHIGVLDVLYGARRVLTDLGARPALDTEGEFASIRNMDELWPRATRQYASRPWGQGADGTKWLIRNGGHLWLPTPDEQDARFEQVYGEAQRAAAARHQIASAMRGGFGATPAYATQPGPAAPPVNRSAQYAGAMGLDVSAD
ncbi:hypothetical protein GCM10009817_06600 [Terrabacter lapilli]|uniref:DUF222 domain-containing protein n=1 Tax=Terrabacter lapilli TaxID=436231 RepID=A0ABN2RHQ5_9MICO